MTEYSLRVRPAITSAAQIQIRAKGVLLQNKGTADAYINTHCTVSAGSTLQIAPFPADGIIVDDWNVSFANTGTMRLEIIEVHNNEIIC